MREKTGERGNKSKGKRSEMGRSGRKVGGGHATDGETGVCLLDGA